MWADANGGVLQQVVRLECDGTSISLYDDGVLAQTITDNSISGNLSCGLASHSVDDGLGDDFEAADLAVAFIPYPYPRGLRGGHSVQTGGLV